MCFFFVEDNKNKKKQAKKNHPYINKNNNNKTFCYQNIGNCCLNFSFRCCRCCYCFKQNFCLHFYGCAVVFGLKWLKITLVAFFFLFFFVSIRGEFNKQNKFENLKFYLNLRNWFETRQNEVLFCCENPY